MLGIVGGSFLLHLAAWSFVGGIKGERKHDIIAIEMADAKKKKEEKKEKPKPPPIDVKPEKAKVVAPTPKVAEPIAEALPPPDAHASNMNGFADLGIGPLSNSGGGGVAVGGGGGGGGGGGLTTPVPTATQRHVSLGPPANECGDELVKPKLEHQIQPAYTQEGRQANAEGSVQLEITVDASGHVVSVKVLHGLGFGLDEAAISAARQWTFAPATKCGKAVPTTIKGKVRFSLS